MEPILNSDRDRRTWEWIVRQVGEETARNAIGALAGRRPFVSNLAKALGLVVPENVTLPQADTVQRHISGLKAILSKK